MNIYETCARTWNDHNEAVVSVGSTQDINNSATDYKTRLQTDKNQFAPVYKATH